MKNIRLTTQLRKRYSAMMSIARDGEVDAAELVRVWWCSPSAMGMSLWYLRQLDLQIPRIVYSRGWKKHAMPPRLRKAADGRNTKRTDRHHGGYSVKMCGNPDLPTCPRCAQAGRVSVTGAPVHYTTDDVFRWCEVCGHTPDDSIAVDQVEARAAMLKWEMSVR